jgi:hypothetical protein
MENGADGNYTLETICIQTTITRHSSLTIALEAGWAGLFAGEDCCLDHFPGALILADCRCRITPGVLTLPILFCHTVCMVCSVGSMQWGMVSHGWVLRAGFLDSPIDNSSISIPFFIALLYVNDLCTRFDHSFYFPLSRGDYYLHEILSGKPVKNFSGTQLFLER